MAVGRELFWRTAFDAARAESGADEDSVNAAEVAVVALFLERLGWTVDGVDISEVALERARRRLAQSGTPHRGTLRRGDCAQLAYPRRGYDAVLVYGLYHCLDDAQLAAVQAAIGECLRPGGLVAFAALDDGLPVPDDHGTGPLTLRPRTELLARFADFEQLDVEYGVIREDHLPVAGSHVHSATWGLYRKW